ncbi:MAG TPA: ATP-binding cassette domain-containing protein [Solirubrobacteraceae bacterium]|nr:ATP-binding cassette domain-containing protein [Solirubrobacteraceae bacterium]
MTVSDLSAMPLLVALVGDNGAGKSTLIKAIAGVQPADAGEYWIDGKPVKLRGPSDASRVGIATVHQDLALCDNLDVVGNLYLGSEAVTPWLRALDETAMERRTNELLASLAVTTLAGSRRVAFGRSAARGRDRAREKVAAAITGALPGRAVAA